MKINKLISISIATAATICSLFYFGCKKEEVKLPFWNVLTGTWKINPNYKINQMDFTFPQYDVEGTYVKFRKPTMVEKDKTFQNFYNTVVYKNNEMVFSILNEQGLYFGGGEVFSEIINLFDYGTDASGYSHQSAKKKYVNGHWLVSETGFTKLEIFVTNDERCDTDIGNEDCYDKLLTNLKENMIDKIFLPYPSTNYGQYFKIFSKSANEIEVKVSVPYYRRVINGYSVNDEIVLTLTRINTSDIITIPPFSLGSYQLYNHLKLDNTDNIYPQGSAYIFSEGVDNGCLTMYGFGDYAEVDYDFKPKVPMTLSFWVKPNSVSKTKQVIFSKYKNIYGPFLMSLEKDKFVLEVNDGNGTLQKVSSSKIIKEGEWNQICLSVETNNLATLFINGEADSQGTINSLNNDAGAKILLGTAEDALNNNLDVNFSGSLDEFVFFKKVLSPNEIKQLYIWHLTN